MGENGTKITPYQPFYMRTSLSPQPDKQMYPTGYLQALLLRRARHHSPLNKTFHRPYQGWAAELLKKLKVLLPAKQNNRLTCCVRC